MTTERVRAGPAARYSVRVEEPAMSSNPNDPIRRAEEVEEDVAPREEPGQHGGDADDNVAPDATSTHD